MNNGYKFDFTCILLTKTQPSNKTAPLKQGLFFDFWDEKRYALCGLIIIKRAQEEVD